nr:TldD/PmbA family protein [Prochlorococcus sp. MIT 1300]
MISQLFEAHAAKEGIIKWDLGASQSSDSSVQVDKGQAKQMKAAERYSLTVRVWNHDGLVGITSTSDVSEDGLRNAFCGAKEASYFGNPNEPPDFSPLSKAPLPKLDRPLKQSQGIGYLFHKLKDAEASLLDSHPAIKTIPYNGLAEACTHRLYVNSEGACRQQTRTYGSLYLYARAEEAGRKPRSAGAIRVASGSQDLDILGCVEEASIRTISHLNYYPIQTGKYLICFSPEAFLDLIGSFTSMFNARSILDGVSLTKRDAIGSKIAVPKLTINDNAIHIGNIAASSFDGEGTPTRDLCIVNGGIIENFLHSEATAREFGVNPTGHAGIGSKVSVGPDWLDIKRSTTSSSLPEELNHTNYDNPFILVESLNALHAGVKASQGSFSLPFDGWLVKGGERISIEAATIAGDIRNVLSTIVEIEKNQSITPSGACPHVWVEELSITGEA